MSLAVKNLDYEIGNERILDQISLEIKEGEFVGLVGPNGCGKSTLLKHIYRTYKPKGQTVFLDGKDIMDLSAKKLAGELAVMAQENQLEFDFTVRDMVMFGRYAHKKFLEGDTAKDRELCEKCLREVGLSGYETRSYLSLSGGEKQRVLLARVLMQESRYIVLDEPTNHLDVSYQYQIMDILRNQDVTVFSSIHDLNLAALYCDRIIFLYQGKIIDRGTPEEVLTKECSHREDADLLSAGMGEGKGLNRNRGQICLLDEKMEESYSRNSFVREKRPRFRRNSGLFFS